MPVLQTVRAYLLRPFLPFTLPDSKFMPEPSPLVNRNDCIDCVLSSVQVMSTDIEALYDNFCSSSCMDDLKHCVVLNVDHRKASSGSYHESIHITMEITGPVSQHKYTRYLKVERLPLKDGSLEQRLDMKAKNGQIPAQDSIQVSSQPDVEGTYSVCTMTFPDSAPNILHLISMCRAIMTIAPEYRLYTYSCYWFARMVFEGLHYQFQGAAVPDSRHHASRGTWSGLKYWSVRVIVVDAECRFNLSSEPDQEVKAKEIASAEEPELQYKAPSQPISPDDAAFVTTQAGDTPARAETESPPSAVTAMLKRYGPMFSRLMEALAQNHTSREDTVADLKRQLRARDEEVSRLMAAGVTA